MRQLMTAPLARPRFSTLLLGTFAGELFGAGAGGQRRCHPTRAHRGEENQRIGHRRFAENGDRLAALEPIGAEPRGDPLDLPTLEPRGAACGELRVEGWPLRVIGTHLDLSGLRRRAQVRALLKFVSECEGDCPTVIAGDFNQWGRSTGAMREFGDRWTLITPGASFPSRKPIARLDRLVASAPFSVIASGAHHTALSAIASDHLPVPATLELPNI